MNMLEPFRRRLTSLAVSIMPFVPLPEEWYRRRLVADSERRYADGRWAYMAEVAEAHRYSILAGCCSYFTGPERRVLDVGCGDGILQQRLPYGLYVGIDMNERAIEAARLREDERTRFQCLAASEFDPCGQCFDAVVFNESLYYMPDPLDVLARYRGFLAPGGLIAICMFRTNLARKIWGRIGRTGLVELTSVSLANEWGFSSQARVYAEHQLTPLARRQVDCFSR